MSGGEPRLGRGASARREKQVLRISALKKRRSIDPDTLQELSLRVEENLASLEEYKSARVIVSYCAKEDEVQTRHIIERALSEGKRVAVVLTNVSTRTLSFSEIRSFDDLAPGAFGILEPRRERLRPVPISAAGAILVPLVAWDRMGHRLGYGAGYFDRALSKAKGVVKIGLALESQALPSIPESRHDVPLDIIVTEQRVVRVKP